MTMEICNKLVSVCQRNVDTSLVQSLDFKELVTESILETKSKTCQDILKLESVVPHHFTGIQGFQKDPNDWDESADDTNDWGNLSDTLYPRDDFLLNDFLFQTATEKPDDHKNNTGARGGIKSNTSLAKITDEYVSLVPTLEDKVIEESSYTNKDKIISRENPNSLEKETNNSDVVEETNSKNDLATKEATRVTQINSQNKTDAHKSNSWVRSSLSSNRLVSKSHCDLDIDMIQFSSDIGRTLPRRVASVSACCRGHSSSRNGKRLVERLVTKLKLLESQMAHDQVVSYLRRWMQTPSCRDFLADVTSNDARYHVINDGLSRTAAIYSKKWCLINHKFVSATEVNGAFNGTETTEVLKKRNIMYDLIIRYMDIVSTIFEIRVCDDKQKLKKSVRDLKQSYFTYKEFVSVDFDVGADMAVFESINKDSQLPCMLAGLKLNGQKKDLKSRSDNKCVDVGESESRGHKPDGQVTGTVGLEHKCKDQKLSTGRGKKWRRERKFHRGRDFKFDSKERKVQSERNDSNKTTGDVVNKSSNISKRNSFNSIVSQHREQTVVKHADAKDDIAKGDGVKDVKAKDDRFKDERAKVNRIKGVGSKDDRVKFDSIKGAGTKDDRVKCDSIKGAGTKDDRVKCDSIKGAGTKDDRVKCDIIKGAGTKDDRVKCDSIMGAGTKDDRVKCDIIKGAGTKDDRVRCDSINGAGTKDDRAKHDRAKDDRAKGDGGKGDRVKSENDIQIKLNSSGSQKFVTGQQGLSRDRKFLLGANRLDSPYHGHGHCSKRRETRRSETRARPSEKVNLRRYSSSEYTMVPRKRSPHHSVETWKRSNHCKEGDEVSRCESLKEVRNRQKMLLSVDDHQKNVEKNKNSSEKYRCKTGRKHDNKFSKSQTDHKQQTLTSSGSETVNVDHSRGKVDYKSIALQRTDRARSEKFKIEHHFTKSTSDCRISATKFDSKVTKSDASPPYGVISSFSKQNSKNNSSDAIRSYSRESCPDLVNGITRHHDKKMYDSLNSKSKKEFGNNKGLVRGKSLFPTEQGLICLECRHSEHSEKALTSQCSSKVHKQSVNTPMASSEIGEADAEAGRLSRDNKEDTTASRVDGSRCHTETAEKLRHDVGGKKRRHSETSRLDDDSNRDKVPGTASINGDVVKKSVDDIIEKNIHSRNMEKIEKDQAAIKRQKTEVENIENKAQVTIVENKAEVKISKNNSEVMILANKIEVTNLPKKTDVTTLANKKEAITLASNKEVTSNLVTNLVNNLVSQTAMTLKSQPISKTECKDYSTHEQSPCPEAHGKQRKSLNSPNTTDDQLGHISSQSSLVKHQSTIFVRDSSYCAESIQTAENKIQTDLMYDLQVVPGVDVGNVGSLDVGQDQSNSCTLTDRSNEITKRLHASLADPRPDTQEIDALRCGVFVGSVGVNKVPVNKVPVNMVPVNKVTGETMVPVTNNNFEMEKILPIVSKDGGHEWSVNISVDATSLDTSGLPGCAHLVGTKDALTENDRPDPTHCHILADVGHTIPDGGYDAPNVGYSLPSRIDFDDYFPELTTIHPSLYLPSRNSIYNRVPAEVLAKCHSNDPRRSFLPNQTDECVHSLSGGSSIQSSVEKVSRHAECPHLNLGSLGDEKIVETNTNTINVLTQNSPKLFLRVNDLVQNTNLPRSENFNDGFTQSKQSVTSTWDDGNKINGIPFRQKSRGFARKLPRLYDPIFSSRLSKQQTIEILDEFCDIERPISPLLDVDCDYFRAPISFSKLSSGPERIGKSTFPHSVEVLSSCPLNKGQKPSCTCSLSVPCASALRYGVCEITVVQLFGTLFGRPLTAAPSSDKSSININKFDIGVQTRTDPSSKKAFDLNSRCGFEDGASTKSEQFQPNSLKCHCINSLVKMTGGTIQQDKPKPHCVYSKSIQGHGSGVNTYNSLKRKMGACEAEPGDDFGRNQKFAKIDHFGHETKIVVSAEVNINNCHLSGGELADDESSTNPSPLVWGFDNSDNNSEPDNFMCDIMSTPIVLCAADRVYHVSRTEHDHVGSILDLNSQTMVHARCKDEVRGDMKLEECSSDSGSSQDLLARAMDIAGISEKTIDTFFKSDCSIHSFLLNDIYIPPDERDYQCVVYETEEERSSSDVLERYCPIHESDIHGMSSLLNWDLSSQLFISENSKSNNGTRPVEFLDSGLKPEPIDQTQSQPMCNEHDITTYNLSSQPMCNEHDMKMFSLAFQPMNNEHQFTVYNNMATQPMYNEHDVKMYNLSSQPMYNENDMTMYNLPSQPMYNENGMTMYNLPSQPVYNENDMTMYNLPSQPVYNENDMTMYNLPSQPVNIENDMTMYNLPSQPVYNENDMTMYDTQSTFYQYSDDHIPKITLSTEPHGCYRMNDPPVFCLDTGGAIALPKKEETTHDSWTNEMFASNEWEGITLTASCDGNVVEPLETGPCSLPNENVEDFLNLSSESKSLEIWSQKVCTMIKSKCRDSENSQNHQIYHITEDPYQITEALGLLPSEENSNTGTQRREAQASDKESCSHSLPVLRRSERNCQKQKHLNVSHGHASGEDTHLAGSRRRELLRVCLEREVAPHTRASVRRKKSKAINKSCVTGKKAKNRVNNIPFKARSLVCIEETPSPRGKIVTRSKNQSLRSESSCSIICCTPTTSFAGRSTQIVYGDNNLKTEKIIPSCSVQIIPLEIQVKDADSGHRGGVIIPSDTDQQNESFGADQEPGTEQINPLRVYYEKRLASVKRFTKQLTHASPGLLQRVRSVEPSTSSQKVDTITTIFRRPRGLYKRQKINSGSTVGGDDEVQATMDMDELNYNNNAGKDGNNDDSLNANKVKDAKKCHQLPTRSHQNQVRLPRVCDHNLSLERSRKKLAQLQSKILKRHMEMHQAPKSVSFGSGLGLDFDLKQERDLGFDVSNGDLTHADVTSDDTNNICQLPSVTSGKRDRIKVVNFVKRIDSRYGDQLAKGDTNTKLRLNKFCKDYLTLHGVRSRQDLVAKKTKPFESRIGDVSKSRCLVNQESKCVTDVNNSKTQDLSSNQPFSSAQLDLPGHEGTGSKQRVKSASEIHSTNNPIESNKMTQGIMETVTVAQVAKNLPTQHEKIKNKKMKALRPDILNSVNRLAAKPPSPTARLLYQIQGWEKEFGKSLNSQENVSHRNFSNNLSRLRSAKSAPGTSGHSYLRGFVATLAVNDVPGSHRGREEQTQRNGVSAREKKGSQKKRYVEDAMRRASEDFSNDEDDDKHVTHDSIDTPEPLMFSDRTDDDVTKPATPALATTTQALGDHSPGKVEKNSGVAFRCGDQPSSSDLKEIEIEPLAQIKRTVDRSAFSLDFVDLFQQKSEDVIQSDESISKETAMDKKSNLPETLPCPSRVNNVLKHPGTQTRAICHAYTKVDPTVTRYFRDRVPNAGKKGKLLQDESDDSRENSEEDEPSSSTDDDIQLRDPTEVQLVKCDVKAGIDESFYNVTKIRVNATRDDVPVMDDAPAMDDVPALNDVPAMDDVPAIDVVPVMDNVANKMDDVVPVMSTKATKPGPVIYPCALPIGITEDFLRADDQDLTDVEQPTHESPGAAESPCSQDSDLLCYDFPEFNNSLQNYPVSPVCLSPLLDTPSTSCLIMSEQEAISSGLCDVLDNETCPAPDTGHLNLEDWLIHEDETRSESRSSQSSAQSPDSGHDVGRDIYRVESLASLKRAIDRDFNTPFEDVPNLVSLVDEKDSNDNTGSPSEGTEQDILWPQIGSTGSRTFKLLSPILEDDEENEIFHNEM